MTYTELIMSIPYVPLLVACLYAAFAYRRFTRPNKALSWFIFVTTLIQFISLGLWTQKMNNLPVSHLYTAVGFVGIMWFYREVLRNYISDLIFLWTAGLFVGFAIVNAVVFQGIYTFNSYPLTAQCVVVIIFSMLTFIVLLNENVKQEQRKYLRSLHWINNGFFIFFACTILLFYFGRVIIDTFTTEASLYTWILHSFFATVLYTCFAIGLWIQPKK